MQSKITLWLGCLVIAGYGCSSRIADVRTEKAPQIREIVHIETRNEVTTVMSGPAGRRYTVRAKDGGTLEERISEQQLYARFPEIYRLLKTSYASSGRDRSIWAGGNL